MINRKIILGTAALLATAQTAGAMPTIPDPETPPVTVQFSSTYYTNIAGSSAALAASRGLKQADVVYAPAVLANLVEPMGGVTFFLAGQAGYDFHQRNSILDRERIDLQAGADTRLAACETTVVGSWGRHQSDLMDLNVGTTKNTAQLLTAGLDATCDQLGRFVPSASVSQSWSDNSAPQYSGQDYHSFLASASVGYKSEQIGTVSLIGQYTQTAYPHRVLVSGTGSQTDGYNLYSGGVMYERDIGATVKFTGSVMETSLSESGGLGSSFSSITYDANIAYNPTARLSFLLDLGRHATPSYYLNAAYAVNEKYSGEVDYRLTSRLLAKLGVADNHTNFAGAALQPGINITDQTYWNYFGSLAFNVSPTLSVSMNAGEDQRHANVIGYSYSGAHVGLAVSKAF